MSAQVKEAKSQAEVWLDKYNTAKRWTPNGPSAAEREKAKNALREQIEDPSHDQPDVQHMTQNELDGYPFYNFQVFVFTDHSIYVEETNEDQAEIFSEAYASLGEFADVLTSAHSKVIKNIRALAVTMPGTEDGAAIR
jgi:hypothetical protein